MTVEGGIVIVSVMHERDAVLRADELRKVGTHD